MLDNAQAENYIVLTREKGKAQNIGLSDAVKRAGGKILGIGIDGIAQVNRSYSRSSP